MEGGTTLSHGSGGRGYGLSCSPITSGVHQWKVYNLIVLMSLLCEFVCVLVGPTRFIAVFVVYSWLENFTFQRVVV